jgi:hypothetical protein
MKNLVIILITVIFLGANSFASEDDLFFIPISAYNDKWDHRWFTLLPESNLYESVEILSFDNKDFPNSLFVLVKLNFKYEEKQTLYFNNVHKARSWHSNAEFTTMVYSTDGEEGRPKDITLSFTDELDNEIEINFTCQDSEKQSSGFADATRYHALEVFSFIAYEFSSTPDFIAVTINDTRTSYDHQKDSSNYWKYKPVYSYNNYHFVIRSIERYIVSENDKILDRYAQDFEISKDSTEYTLRTKNIGFKKYIEIKADTLKQLKSYTFFNHDDHIRMSFDPHLHTTQTPTQEEGDKEIVKENKFSFSASNVKGSLNGKSLSVLKSGFIHIEWFLLQPEWAAKHSFVTDMALINKNVYKIMILPTQPEK